MCNTLLFFLWRCDPTRVKASSFLRILDHTQRRTTVGRTPLDEWSARRRDLYLTTHNTHNRQTSMPSVGFEPTISAGGAAADLRLRPHGYWDRRNTLLGKHNIWFWNLRYRVNQPWLINFLWFTSTVLPQQSLYFPLSYSLHMHTFISARQRSFHNLSLFYLQLFYP